MRGEWWMGERWGLGRRWRSKDLGRWVVQLLVVHVGGVAVEIRMCMTLGAEGSVAFGLCSWATV